MTEAESERELYRIKCKHLGMEDMCFAHNGWSTNNMMHITLACDCNCRRMKNYDRKHSIKSSTS